MLHQGSNMKVLSYRIIVADEAASMGIQILMS
jgi:hypothetical protein